MPWLRPATDAPFGFMPHGRVLSIGTYFKDASAAAFYPGDALIIESDGGLAVAAASSTDIVGVAVDYTVASVLDRSVKVYDHPLQQYVVQDDNDTTIMAETELGTNVDMVVTTGDTTILRSLHEIDSSSAQTTNALAVKVIALHPIEGINGYSGTYTSSGAQARKWIVMFNIDSHHFNTATGV